MSRKKLDIQEALQLFYDLPSDNESVDSENSCEEDYMTKPLEYTSDSDTASSEDEDINLPGPSQVTQSKSIVSNNILSSSGAVLAIANTTPTNIQWF
ncbi:hypothetical protein NPIL_533451 [Nephila pilipes]|uniref:Uncharacterized protein n=1 Tax=Nephila pilipes TaxID=299642 RepID=A0A8X6MCS9_NEPPI|nr:hypothetical protein NPIL_632721 [Nephila pilipes]GFS93590.1 hypothetical protein NPIL_533451 [Nephila pilipes]